MVNLKQARILSNNVEGVCRKAANTTNYAETIKELKKLIIDQQNYIEKLVLENEMMREYILDKVL